MPLLSSKANGGLLSGKPQQGSTQTKSSPSLQIVANGTSEKSSETRAPFDSTANVRSGTPSSPSKYEPPSSLLAYGISPPPNSSVSVSPFKKFPGAKNLTYFPGGKITRASLIDEIAKPG